MKYKRQEESKYTHYLFSNSAYENGILLLGLRKDMPAEEAELLIDLPMFIQPTEFWNKYFQLNKENRELIFSVLKQLEKEKQNYTSQFHVKYLEIVLDFIFARYDKTIYDIAGDLEGPERKKTYDRLNKALKIKTKPRETETETTIKEVCAFYLLSYDIIKNGRGVMYCLNETENYNELAKQINERYTIKRIRSLWSKNSDISLKNTILELTGLKEEQLKEIPVQIAFREKKGDDELQKHLVVFMNELCRRQ